MAIMDEVNFTVNTSTEGVEGDAYTRIILTSGTEVIDKMNWEDPGSPEKQLKNSTSRYGDYFRSSNIKFYH